MASGCLGACEMKTGGHRTCRQQAGRGADPWTGLGVQAQGGRWLTSQGRQVVALAWLLQAVLSASLQPGLHGCESFSRPVEGIGLLMMLQFLKYMTNT